MTYRVGAALRVPLLVDDGGHRLARLRGALAGAARLLVRVAEGERGADQTLRRDAEQPLGGLPPAPAEPADARADPVRMGGEHQPLAQPPLVQGLLPGPLA